MPRGRSRERGDSEGAPARIRDERGASLDDFHCGDEVMCRCLERARVAAATDLPVLILGESGTGKTQLARAVHNSSRRAGRPFVAFNAAALSETLIDSQLFGHEKGAFTGADARVQGKFELADGGTLFLDEIGDLSPGGQAKILRAVEHGEFERLGSAALVSSDVRIIAATHMPLPQLVGERFRRDLFYRLQGITLTLPPLRDRPNDLRALLAAEIRRASEAQGKEIQGLDREAADRLIAHSWPGNLRELKTVVHAAVAMTRDVLIRSDSLLLGESAAAPAGPAAGAALPAGTRPVPAADDLSLKGAEQRHIHWVLAQVGGNKRQAARALGVSRSTLARKLTI